MLWVVIWERVCVCEEWVMNVRVKYGGVVFGYVNENVVVGLNVEWEFDCVSVSIVDDDVSVLCKLYVI